MRLSRDSNAAALASAAFVLVVVLGFYKTRGPSEQRLLRADQKRIQNVQQLANQINMEYQRHIKQLPSELTSVQKSSFKDPLTGKALEYATKSATRYAICTTFSRAVPKDDENSAFAFWDHAAGYKCFEFDASEQVPNVPYYYP